MKDASEEFDNLPSEVKAKFTSEYANALRLEVTKRVD